MRGALYIGGLIDQNAKGFGCPVKPVRSKASARLNQDVGVVKCALSHEKFSVSTGA